MRAPSFLVGFTAAASLFGGSLASPCRVSSSTTPSIASTPTSPSSTNTPIASTPTSSLSASTPSASTPTSSSLDSTPSASTPASTPIASTPANTPITPTLTSSSSTSATSDSTSSSSSTTSTSTTSTTTTTTSTTSTSAPTFTIVAGNAADSRYNGKLLQYSTTSNGQPLYLAAEGGLQSNYHVAPVTLEPVTNRLKTGNIYPYARPATFDSSVYTGTSTYIDSSAGTIYAAAYIKCNTPVIQGTALQCQLEGSTKTQFRVQYNSDNTLTLYIGDPSVVTANSDIDFIVA